MKAESWTIEKLEPFGVLIVAKSDGAAVTEIPRDTITDLLSTDRLVLLREFSPLLAEDFPDFSSGFGEVLEFDFGVVNELRNVADATNYLYTTGEVPFHWDGAFIGRIPNYIFFHCDIAPASGSGGETLFTDTTKMLAIAAADVRKKWESIEITYSTEKVVHYGGTFSSRMLAEHPLTRERVIRYAEPVNDLNPVHLEIFGIHPAERTEFLADIHERLNDAAVCYVHAWQPGDLLIADNHALLHGRRAFRTGTDRLIRRVNIQ